jgi:hypothetical protein
MSHLLRYSHYPEPVLLLDSPEDLDGENLDFIEIIYGNSQRGMTKVLKIKQDVEEICNEVINY